MSGSQFVQRGQALVDRRQFQEAVKVCRLGLLANPTEVAGRLVLATALAELERYDEVLAEMRVALELEPTNARAHVLKARALLRKGDALQAREILDRAVQLDPTEHDAQELLREANEALGGSGKPRPRLAGAGIVDSFDSHTKHYPAHLGTGAGPGSITRPRDGLIEDVPGPEVLAVGDRSGTIELDPELEGIEIGAVPEEAPLAEPPLPVSEDSVVELDTGDVELVTGSDVAPLPGRALGLDGPEEETAHYRRAGAAGKGREDRPAERPSQQTIPESPYASRRRAAPGSSLDSAPPLDELFPEHESGVSSVDLSLAPVSGSIETPPHHNVPGQPGFGGGPSIPSLAHSREPARLGAPIPDPSPRSRTEDMAVIKQGLGIEDSADRARRRRRPSRKDRTRAIPQRRRPRRKRGHVWLYALVAVVVVAGAVFAGLAVRNARLDRQIKRAMRDADRLSATDTYRGYVRASEAYTRIIEARDDSETRAAAARVEAAIAAEFGDRAERARDAVARVGDASSEDALAARAYLAIAEADVASALQQAQKIVDSMPDSRLGHYLLGRATLLDGQPEAAAEAFRASLAKSVSPAAYVGLGIAEATMGRFPEALAAFDAATNLSEAHPAAVIERARVLVVMNQLPPPEQPEKALEGIIAEGKRPIAEQKIGVARQQIGWAALALAEVAIARGDRAKAKRAIETAVQSRPLTDWRFSDALSAAYLATDNLEKARAEAETALAKWPQRAGVHARVAEAALAAGDPEASLAAIGKVTDIDKRPEALAVRGRARLALHQLDAAAADLDAALAARPQLRKAQIARAEVDLHRGDAGSAVKRLQPIYEASSSPEIGIVYASALRRSGERERARTVLERALESPRSGAAGHLELARLNRDEGRFKAARQSYASAIEADPDGVDPRLEAAQLAHDLGDVQGAREALDALAGDAPGDGRVLLAAARVHTMVGDPDGAARLIDEADKLSTTPRWLVERERGRMLLRTQSTAQAIERLIEVVRERPDDGEARLLLIDAYLTSENAKGANDALADVLKQFANRPEADLALGRVHLFNDRLRDAMISFKNARRSLAANNAPPRRLSEAHFWMGRVYYFDSSLRNARKELARAVKLDPGNADAYFALGQVEYDSDKVKAAVAAWKSATEADPRGIPDAWFFLGESYAKLRKKKEARQALERFLEIVPTGDLAAEARELLQEL